MKDMTGIIISGLPASGKGTQAALVADEYGFAHIDVGESLREEVDQDSKIGRDAEKHISKGELVPDKTIEKLLKKKIEENKDVEGIVFDGFPRTTEQAEMLEKLSQVYQLKVKGMIHLETDEDVIQERIQKRAEESGRKDDQNQNIIQQRIDEQKKQLYPLLDYYKEQKKLFTVNGNPGINQVFDAVKKTIEEHHLAEK